MTANRRGRMAGAMLAVTGVLLAAIVDGAEPDTAVRATWAELDAGWNARDADRFSAVFTADASFDFVDRGEGFDSRDEIHASFAARFPRFAPELRHATTVRAVRPFGDELAAVDGSVEILRHGPGEETVDVLKRFAIFAVMEQRQRRWYVAMLRAYELPPSDDDDAAAKEAVQKSSHSR